jgi:hypothetical protein
LPDSLDGKQIRCKRCNKVLNVRAASSKDGSLSESQRIRVEKELTVKGTRPCPGCGKTYPPAIVVCVDCGLNVDSGAMLYASLEEQTSGAKPDGKAPEDRGAAPKASAWQRLLRTLGLGRKG